MRNMYMTTDTKPVMIRAMPTDLWHKVRVTAAILNEGVSEFVIKAVERRVKVANLQHPRKTE